MPPSGYTREQSSHLEPMLRSCATALVEEARDNGETFVQALCREIESIAWYMSQDGRSTAQRGMLILTAAFYEEVERHSPECVEDFWSAVRQATRHIEEQVLLVKIPVRQKVI